MRLHLEVLEDRTVPAVLNVVSSSIPATGSNFHSLAAAIAAAANTGDTIVIGAGSAPGTANSGFKVLTFEGDPTAGLAALPAITSLTLQSVGNVVMDLNLSDLEIADGATGQTITNCVIQNFTQQDGVIANGSNFISSNTITGTMVVGNAFPNLNGAVNDTIINNTFLSSTGSTTLLNISHDNGAVIQGNTFESLFDASLAIQVEDSTSALVADNTILLSGPNSVGVEVENPDFDTAVAVNNNRIDTNGQGTGILTEKTGAGLTLSVSISGNDLVRNNIGLNVQGGGTIDAGNGTLGSLGGNDFHGYLSTAGGTAAIMAGSGTGLVSAELNIFSVSPSLVINGSGATIDVNSPLSANQSFVQTLYSDFLGRTGSVAELNGWVGSLPALGQGGVANAIIHSQESFQHLVAGLYAKLLGRVGSTAEEAGWVSYLTNGATEEQVMSGILSSSEFAAHAQIIAPSPSDPSTDYVEALFVLLLGRQGSSTEITGWLKRLPSLGSAGVATGILSSSEFRTDFVQLLYSTDTAFQSPSFLDNPPNMLHRIVVPSIAEASIWSASPLDLLSIEADIGGSGEFFANG